MPFIAIAWRDQILMHHHHHIHSITSAGNTSQHTTAKLYTMEKTEIISLGMWMIFMMSLVSMR